MNIVKVKKGEPVVRKQDRITEWYLIQEGKVSRKYPMAEVLLGPNSIVGILESEWFSCDYVAEEDTALIIIPCHNSDSLTKLLGAHANFCPIFLRTALEQRHKMLCLYADLQMKCGLLHTSAESFYQDYQTMCDQFVTKEQDFSRILDFEALSMNHKAQNWEMMSSNALISSYLKEYMNLMTRDVNLCVGAIMECSAQMFRVSQGITEMTTYLRSNREIIANDNENDIFHLFTRLAADCAGNAAHFTQCCNKLEKILHIMKELDIYDSALLSECESVLRNNSFGQQKDDLSVNLATEDCVFLILDYAGYEKQEIREFKQLLEDYKALGDFTSTDDHARGLRKTITRSFYEIYEKAFFRSMEEAAHPSPILMMFFHFGFMDTSLVGLDAANQLMHFTEKLDLFHSDHVYTLYQWLQKIYQGEAEPSKNDLDLDYRGYLAEQRRLGEITEAEAKAFLTDLRQKVHFEIQYMFQTGQRATFGRITTFCPVLTNADFLTSLEKMALTADRLESSINRIRSIDYSVFYRQQSFSDSARGINQEWLMHEILPDIILMPGTGSRAMMWQETASVKNDTPARFLFPIFLTGHLEDQMICTIARYRWEICRKIQGVRWNDFREKSLTSAYCDYLQFYRKNKDLSAETKERIATTLQHVRNNYREVFVSDYVMWLKYESTGSFRLNKLARQILITYCPFSRSLRDSLDVNPLYQNAFKQLDTENQRTEARYTALYAKYESAGGTITPELKENLKFYQL